MVSIFKNIFLFTILLFTPIVFFGQVQNDCENAVAVCTNAGSNGIVNGLGTDDFNGASSSGCLGTGGVGSTTVESNSAWYTFTLAVNGQFGFDIAPNVLSEDWDFALYGPFANTTENCNNLGTPVACNYSGTTGYTGVGVDPITGTQTAPYSPWVNGLAGETYVLLINNYSATNSGFTFTFTGNIFNTQIPALDCSVVTPIAYCPGENINLDATTPNATTYVWDENGTVLSATGPILSGIPATTTQYHVQAFNANGNLVGEQTFNITVPNAGTNGFINFCSTDAPTDLFASLGGTPDVGGTWSPTLASGTGVFDPSVDVAGAYTYTIEGSEECVVTAIVTVGLTQAPNAGINGSINFCSTDTPTDLFASLGGTPDTGGTWSPALASGTGVFDPSVDTAGTYTYTVTATGFCSTNAAATVTVTVNTAPNAGTNGSINFCSTDAPIDLFTSLGGTPDVGGTWSPALASGTGVFDPSVDAAGTYTYTVAGTGACADATAIVTVGLTQAPNSGTVVALSPICDTETAFDLTAGLTGQDAGGTWNDDDATGGLSGNTFDATGLAGTYNFTYTVNPTSPCAVANSTTIQVTVIRSPDAGIDGDVFFCMSDASADLFSSLGGTPDLGGTWSPNPVSNSGIFNPAVDAAGIYTYTVSSSGVCNATATVTVTLSEAPIIISVDVVDFSDNNTITVNVEGLVSGTSFGIGDFEYSIDGVSFQSENVIQNVAPGTYTVTVRDANGCLPDAFQPNVIVMGAPKFFTPNNDGRNDTWQIYNIQSQPNAQIRIYDRFGKFITKIDPNSPGWDGYYNGEYLPSTDYWFSVKMEDADGNPVERRGNFSLIRR